MFINVLAVSPTLISAIYYLVSFLHFSCLMKVITASSKCCNKRFWTILSSACPNIELVNMQLFHGKCLCAACCVCPFLADSNDMYKAQGLLRVAVPLLCCIFACCSWSHNGNWCLSYHVTCAWMTPTAISHIWLVNFPKNTNQWLKNVLSLLTLSGWKLTEIWG